MIKAAPFNQTSCANTLLFPLFCQTVFVEQDVLPNGFVFTLLLLCYLILRYVERDLTPKVKKNGIRTGRRTTEAESKLTPFVPLNVNSEVSIIGSS